MLGEFDTDIHRDSAMRASRSDWNPEQLAAAKAAIARMQAREGEDIDAWAEELARQLAQLPSDYGA
jgi:hypothetical protein